MASVLTVEDSSFQRNRIKKILAEGGYEILEAENGLAGLEVAESEKPDCILSDLLMPELDGFGLLESLRDKGIEIPVIILTADIQDSVKKKMFGPGGQRFFEQASGKGRSSKCSKGNTRLRLSGYEYQ